ncbi:nuclear transport factor 2 family protein [Gramella jeungdoensis]|uniref:Nuclear transport factor 2 family protein n=1 Tax=Gramella jeungdoensis TaxID=708091 RepID=A0ABT0YZP3_9FLAO|nr:nuclear transport factor 2 family protein [Gramella jeungdoensis]MCM8568615.1 nuclear transport factor 2 family protein [Gramella jeungdoensis]
MKRIITLLVLIFLSCNQVNETANIETWKNEIIETEAAFAKMAAEEGIPTAFLFYAAEDVAVLRNDKLILGREALKNSYPSLEKKADVSLSWKPDFVDVSSSGDLGYTYGKYVYKVTDSLGNENVSEGIFHTVWKRQPDGNWKFVWD